MSLSRFPLPRWAGSGSRDCGLLQMFVGCSGRFWEVLEGRETEQGGAGLSLWEDEELDEADEAEDQQGTGHVGSETGIHFLRILRGRRLGWHWALPSGGACYQASRGRSRWPS